MQQWEKASRYKAPAVCQRMHAQLCTYAVATRSRPEWNPIPLMARSIPCSVTVARQSQGERSAAQRGAPGNAKNAVSAMTGHIT